MSATGTILIADQFRQSLVVVRSLGRQGHRLLVSRDRKPGFVERSRFASGIWEVDGTSAEVYLSQMLLYLAEHREVTALFPVGELTLERLASALARFEPGITLVMPAPEIVVRCLDKSRMNALASELGIPLPPSAPFLSAPECRAKASEFGFPCVIKRKNSFAMVRGRKALILESAEELDAYLAGDSDSEPASLILQKFMRGSRHNCQFAAAGGKVVAYFEQKVLRTDTWDGTGFGVEGISVPPSADLRAWTEAIAARLGYTGVGCVQFLVEPGGASFLELNPRLDATCAIAAYCGVDFPELALRCALHRRGLGPAPDPVSADYPSGVRAYWMLGDLLGWLHAVNHREVTAGQALSWAARSFVAALTTRRHLTWSWSDPIPTLVFYRLKAGEILAAIINRVFRRARP